MECFECGKEMTMEDGEPSLTDCVIRVSPASENVIPSPGTVDYFNKQLGKHSDGAGSCHIEICFGCYIDGVLGTKGVS